MGKKSTENTAAKGGFPVRIFLLLHCRQNTSFVASESVIETIHSTSVTFKGESWLHSIYSMWSGILHTYFCFTGSRGSGILTQPRRAEWAGLQHRRFYKDKLQPSPSLQAPWACHKPLPFLPDRKHSAVMESAPVYHRAGKKSPHL